jgi:hypothetical protein
MSDQSDDQIEPEDDFDAGSLNDDDLDLDEDKDDALVFGDHPLDKVSKKVPDNKFIPKNYPK